MSFKFNPLTGELDIVRKNSAFDSRYVLIVGDTMTGKLTINPSSGDTALHSKKDIILKAGQKLYFDGN